MTFVPILFSEWWKNLDHPHRLLDQDFGLGLHQDQLLSPHVLERYLSPIERCLTSMDRRTRNPSIYYRPWDELLRKNNAGTSTINADKNKFQVILDVQQFKPDEINVKVVDKYIVVEANHEERQDEHGWISRQFVRKYMIPEQCDIDQASSSLSSDGVLTISVPTKNIPKQDNERSIKIEHTGKPAIREQNSDKKCVKDAKEDKSEK